MRNIPGAYFFMIAASLALSLEETLDLVEFPLNEDAQIDDPAS